METSLVKVQMCSLVVTRDVFNPYPKFTLAQALLPIGFCGKDVDIRGWQKRRLMTLV